jgi:hypothetical protein
MSDTPQEREQSTQERAYAVICLVALFLVVVVMMLDGMGVWSVLPMLIGGVAFLLRWRSGPPLVLFVFLWMAPTRFQHALEPDTFMSAILNSTASLGNHAGRWWDLSASLEDVILCAALLTYTAACYRALSLSHSIFPPDSRRPPGTSKDQGKAVLAPASALLVPRPAQPVNTSELPFLLVVLSGAVLLGLLVWFLSGFLRPEFEMKPAAAWRNVVFFWAFVLVVSLSVAFFRYLGRRGAPTEENLLYLQDQLWRQTRHEQSVVNRWLVWARLRGQRRKEQ